MVNVWIDAESTSSCVGYVSFLEAEGQSLQQTAQRKAKELAKKAGVGGKSLRLPLLVRDLSQAGGDEALLALIPGPDSGYLSLFVCLCLFVSLAGFCHCLLYLTAFIDVHTLMLYMYCY
jgi:hypothetical protein